VIVIMTDDQTVESLRVMPNVQRILADQGVTFDDSVVSFSLCCPSRATFLTGQYAHNHGVFGNRPPNGGYYKLDSTNTLPVWLQKAGYYTAHVGKYLNSYGYFNPLEVPSGWSEWHGAVDPSAYNYFGYYLNEDGRLVNYGNDPPSYQSDVYAWKAAYVIRSRAPSPQPYFLSIAFLAPHAASPEGSQPPPGYPFGLPVPAPRHQGSLASEPLPTPQSFNEVDVSDKPADIRAIPLMSDDLIGKVQENYRRRLESLLAVDEALRGIWQAVEDTGEAANTVVIFTSDNGYLQGEHRIPNGKVLPYEPSIRVPLVLRGPGIPAGKHLRQQVWNGDLAPTILDLAGATAGRTIDGESLVPLFRDRGLEWGRDVLLEAGADGGGGIPFEGLRTDGFVYLEYANGDRELYDLAKDPDELQSVHADPAYVEVRDELARRLAALRVCAGAACHAGPSLRLDVGYSAGAAHCARDDVTARVAGPDARWLAQVDFRVGGRATAKADSAPFSKRISRLAFRRGKSARLRARAQLRDGRVLTLDRSILACGRGTR
jgi:arylsulfatase A-like enzyme